MRTRIALQIILGLLCCVYTLTFSQTVVSVPAVQMWTFSGISLAAGQPYKISTSGTWNGAPGYTYDATGARGGYSGMSTHPDMCLLGKIGSSVFYLGNGGSLSAPSAGTFYLGPNDGPTADCWGDNSGSLSCNVNGTIVSIIANQTWTSTGISFSSGEAMTISASGTWSGAPGYTYGPLGACGGYSGMSAYPNMCLLGKIGGNVFYMGSGGNFTAESSGTLYLGPNDGPTADCWGDNSGSLSITITTESVSTLTTPSGSSSGQSGQSLSFSTGGAACTQGHSVEHRFDWGDGYTSSYGSATQSHIYTSPGTFLIKAQARCSVDNSVVSSWSNSMTINISTPSNNLPWIFINTGISHTIIIPLQASPNINNTVLTEGDYIGIFYDKDGTLTCGGNEKWTGAGNISVSAFGNDATTTDKDGFNEGEAFRWKVFRHSDGMLFDANVAYLAIGSMGGIISHTGSYSSGGISGLAVFNGGITTHSLNLRLGWRLISSFVDPQQPSLDEVYKSIKADVIIIKNGAQKVYIPSQGINSIGNWINIEGYQVKMNAAKTLELKGLKITPEVTNINLSAGWSILGYCRDKEISVSSALSNHRRICEFGFTDSPYGHSNCYDVMLN